MQYTLSKILFYLDDEKRIISHNQRSIDIEYGFSYTTDTIDYWHTIIIY